MFNESLEGSKLRLSHFHTRTPDYLKYARAYVLFRSDDCSLSYRPSTKHNDLEASRVVFGRHEKFIDRRCAVYNAEDSITTVAELGLDLLRAR